SRRQIEGHKQQSVLLCRRDPGLMWAVERLDGRRRRRLGRGGLVAGAEPGGAGRRQASPGHTRPQEAPARERPWRAIHTIIDVTMATATTTMIVARASCCLWGRLLSSIWSAAATAVHNATAARKAATIPAI